MLAEQSLPDYFAQLRSDRRRRRQTVVLNRLDACRHALQVGL